MPDRPVSQPDPDSVERLRILRCPTCGAVGMECRYVYHHNCWGEEPLEQLEYVPASELARLKAALERFLDVWDEFDGPPLTVQETYDAVAESVEEVRAALRPVKREGEG